MFDRHCNNYNGISKEWVVAVLLSLIISDGSADHHCSPETTILPSPDGDPDLDMKFFWPGTVLGMTSELECPCNLLHLGSSDLLAHRTCGGDFESGAVWNPPMNSMCDFSITARKLCKLANLDDEALLFNLDSITSNSSTLGSTELIITSALLNRAQSGASGNATLTDSASNTIDNILRADRDSQIEGQRMSGSQSRMRNAFENMIHNYPIPEGQTNVVVTRDLVAFRVDLVSPIQTNLNTSDLNQDILPPVSVQVITNLKNVTNYSSFKSTTAVYVNNGLYIESDSEIVHGVIDFNINNMEVKDLQEPVDFTFDISMVDESLASDIDDLKCVFWNTKMNQGLGGWSSAGVCTRVTSNGKIECSTDHLTSFSILLDVAAADQTSPLAEGLAFTILTYIGNGVSIVCLLITLFTYICSSKLRNHHGKLLSSQCFALLCLYLTFFLASQGSKISVFVCGFVGALLHYFLLVVFFIMAALAIDLFIKLVIVLGFTIQHYLIKTVIVVWILPLFIVPFTIAPDYEKYVHDHYCGATGPALYVGVLFPFLVVYIFNVAIFFIILISLLKSQANIFGKAENENRKRVVIKQLCRVAFTLSILFGLGWGFGLLSTQAIGFAPIRIFFNAMFSVLVCFQGFFIFLLYIVLSPSAKKEWRNWIIGKEGSVAIFTMSKSSSLLTTYIDVVGNERFRDYANKRSGTPYHNVSTTINALESELQMMNKLAYNLEKNKKNTCYTDPLDEYEDMFLSGLNDTLLIEEADVHVAVSATSISKSSASLTTVDDGHTAELRNVVITLENSLQSAKKKHQVSIEAEELALGLLSSQVSINGDEVQSSGSEVAVAAFSPNSKSPLSHGNNIRGTSLTVSDDDDRDTRPVDVATLENPSQSTKKKRVSLDGEGLGLLSSQGSSDFSNHGVSMRHIRSAYF